MVAIPNGFELIMGMKKDPIFGPVILVGMGGVAAEVFQDRALALPPLNECLPAGRWNRSSPGRCSGIPRPAGGQHRPPRSRSSCGSPTSWPTSRKSRSSTLTRCWSRPEDVIALDARVVIDREGGGPTRCGRTAHLAIRPYPEEYVTERRLKNGMTVVLRPIKPEDEPLWHELLASCSHESIRSRFSSLFKQTHPRDGRALLLHRLRPGDGHRGRSWRRTGSGRWSAVGRLVADADHDVAEYAVLVGDRWQGRGLGSMLTDYCLEVAKRWGVKRIVAEAAKDNSRMLSIFTNRGFTVNGQQEQDVVLVGKDL